MTDEERVRILEINLRAVREERDELTERLRRLDEEAKRIRKALKGYGWKDCKKVKA